MRFRKTAGPATVMVTGDDQFVFDNDRDVEGLIDGFHGNPIADEFIGLLKSDVAPRPPNGSWHVLTVSHDELNGRGRNRALLAASDRMPSGSKSGVVA